MVETTRCPNCQTEISSETLTCPHCGFLRKTIHFASDPLEPGLFADRPLPFHTWTIVTALFFVPLAACGGCLAAGFSIDHPDSGFANQATFVEIASVAIGIVMLLANIVISVWRQK